MIIEYIYNFIVKIIDDYNELKQKVTDKSEYYAEILSEA